MIEKYYVITFLCRNMDFNYKCPESDDIFVTLKDYLRIKKETKLLELIKDSKFSLRSNERYFDSSLYSNLGSGLNALTTTATFSVPVDKIVEFDEKVKKSLKSYCNEIDSGYEVTAVNIKLKIMHDDSRGLSLEDDIEDIINNKIDSIGISFPPDLYEKGREMAEVYIYLYYVENSLRLFIEDKGNGNLTYTSDLTKKIQNRKDIEKKNQWKSFNTNSEIFYLDLVDLSLLINANWSIFNCYFPNFSWIDTKIKEIGQCRNSVAHNGYIGSHEKELLKVNYNGILRQIGMK